MADARNDRAGGDSWEPGIRHAFRKAGLLGRGEPQAAPDEPVPASRYELRDELSGDSASTLVLARDREVDRDVTLRVLVGNGDESGVRRFLEEAQVGAQLQHPGILPVYGLGLLEDGRAYVASRIVEGEPLSQLVGSGERRERLLAVLELAAHALAYAHARGVAHGNLDSTLIHVGAHGEVVISGWERAVRANWNSSGIGADVEVLLELLGKALGKSVNGKLNSAGAIAAAISRHLAGREARVREAEIAAATARVRAEKERARALESQSRARRERAVRHRTLALAAAVLLIALLGLGGYAWRMAEESAQQARAESQVTAALLEARRCGAAGEWSEAIAWARKAAALARGAEIEMLSEAESELDLAEERFRVASEDAALLADLREARGLPFIDETADEIAARFREAFRKGGLDLSRTEPEAVAAWISSRTRPVELVTRLDEMAMYCPIEERMRLGTAAGLVDPSPWRREARAAVLRGDPDEMRLLASTADVAEMHPRTLAFFGRALLEVDLGIGAALLREGVLRHPTDAWLRETLTVALEELQVGRVRYSPSARHRPVRELSWSAELSRHVAAGLVLDPEARRGWGALEHSLLAQGRFDEALEVAECVVALYPEWAGGHYYLGTLLNDHRFDYEGAVRELRKSIKLAPKVSPQFEERRLIAVARTYGHLGNALDALGRRDEAAKAFLTGYDLTPSTDAATKLDLLGLCQKARGQHSEAVETFKQALDREQDRFYILLHLARELVLLERLGEALPVLRQALETSMPRHRIWLPEIRGRLSFSLLALGRAEEALAATDSEIELSPDGAGVHFRRGWALSQAGRHSEGIVEIRRAIDMSPSWPFFHLVLGQVLLQSGDFASSIDAMRECLRLKPDMSDALNSLAWTLATAPDAALRDPEEAVDLAEKAVRTVAPVPWWRGSYMKTLGVALYRAGKFEMAIETLEASLRLAPDMGPTNGLFIAMSHFQCGRGGPAREWFERSVRSMTASGGGDEELKRFHAEAEALIGVDDSESGK